MGKLQIADEEYYITSDYILDLAKRAPDLYESSEPIEKRQLLKFTLQNLRLDGSLACYDEIKPFDTIRLYASRQAWLPEPHFFIPVDYAPAVQPMLNVGYFGEMKQRWEEIQKLQMKHMLVVRPAV